MNNEPIADAVLRVYKDGYRNTVYVWDVIRRPYCCHKRHTHGGGRPGKDDPREHLGPRVAHCGRDGYELRERK